MDERIRTHPEVRPAKEFAAVEQKAQRRVTIVEETWPQEKVVQQKPRPAVREVEDDWFSLLDVVTKKSGIIKNDLVQLYMQIFIFEFVLKCTNTLICAPTVSLH